MSRRLAGRVAFDVADLEALAELLDVPVTNFFERPVAARGVNPGLGSGNLRSRIPLRAAA